MGSPRMTATQSFGGKPTATHCAVAVEGLERIVRARRHMSTWRRTTGKKPLIAAHTRFQEARDGAHQREPATGVSSGPVPAGANRRIMV